MIFFEVNHKHLLQLLELLHVTTMGAVDGSLGMIISPIKFIGLYFRFVIAHLDGLADLFLTFAQHSFNYIFGLV